MTVHTVYVLFVALSVVKISLTNRVICSNMNGSCSPKSVHYEPLVAENPSEKLIALQFDSFENSTKYTICYPSQTFFDNQTARLKFNLLIHIFCRQLGYTTYKSVKPANITNQRLQQIFPIVNCEGTEQSLKDCEWQSVKLINCEHMVVIECGHCSRRFENSDSGVIQSPGYPDTFFPLTQCDLFIITTADGVDLKFITFNLPSSSLESLYCSPKYAYIEVKPESDIQENTDEILSNSERYCAFRKPEKYIRIESKVIMIHFSGGIFPYKIQNKKAKVGFRIEYKAYTLDSYKYILILGYLFSGIIASFFIFSLFKCCRSQIGNNCNLRKNMCSDVSESDSVYEEVPPLPPRVKTSAQLPSISINQFPINRESDYRHSPSSIHALTQITPLASKYTLICASPGNCQYIHQNEIKSHSATRKRSNIKSHFSSSNESSLKPVIPTNTKLTIPNQTPIKLLNGHCQEACKRRLLEYLVSTSTSICHSRDSTICDLSIEHSNEKHSEGKQNCDRSQIKTPPKIYVIDTSNGDGVPTSQSV